ncbi:concanavalin A-like lectin/glucanase domain-containing protein [Rhodocollybia butyracea]|uniref:Concanavalin A-like lectin/glucanase domain-containing protein n=1 Tax=Rhodocollybia butyracea TaxID=206335 RepID=A0A9P5Q4P2_9AGAR|nr:concanavalin A-like lectin/glucanase domain-containing protein [Rhodocollybia butyracea]
MAPPVVDDVHDWSPDELYGSGSVGSMRPPPSSFNFHLGSTSRRSSIESISNTPGGLYMRRFSGSDDYHQEPTAAAVQPPEVYPVDELGRPNAPFMSESGHGHGPSFSQSPSGGNAVYANSAAASLASKGSNHDLARSRNNSMTFRAPFLSPASRPSSSLWAPPTHTHYPQTGPNSPNASSTALAFAPLPRSKEPLPSTLLSEKIRNEEKPWLSKHAPRERLSYFLTVLCMDIDLLDESQLCTVFFDDFTSNSLDTSIWQRTVEMGGFGNGEFEIMTNSDDNLKIQNSQLYIIPTLTSNSINTSAIFNGYTYDLGSDCTTTNKTACSATSDSSTNTVIPPVQSARITTNGTQSLKYGRVQVRAKLPRGDWLWPSIWMLPVDNAYGPWPLSGEIDLMEARGNGINYPAQGVNYVRSSLNYAPMASLLSQSTLFGWWDTKRLDSSSWSTGFHTYTLEWTDKWMRMYVDSRLEAMLDLDIKKSQESFFNRARYPATAINSSTGDTVAVENIWSEAGGGWNAPFDQEFYLIIQVAVGGTSGWFPDGAGGKMWTDGDTDAMFDFAKAQDEWSATWPTSVDDRSLRVDWVKMWKMC